MPISLLSFGVTIAIGLPFLVLIVYVAREAGEFSKLGRAFLSGMVALMIAPTVWQPYHVWYIEAASVVVFTALVGLTDPASAALWGGLPILCVGAFIYFVWNHRKPLVRTA